MDRAVQAVRPADPTAHRRLRHRLVVRVVPRSVQQGVQGLADATRLLRGFDPARDSGD